MNVLPKPTPSQGKRRHFLPGVGNIRLGVEFVLLVDAALDLARADRLNDGRNADQEVVLEFLFLQAGVQAETWPV